MKRLSTFLVLTTTMLAAFAQPAANAYRYNKPTGQSANSVQQASQPETPLFTATNGGPELFGNVIASKNSSETGMNKFTTDGEFTLIANQAKNNLYATPYAGIKLGGFYYSFRTQTIFGFQAKYMGKYDIERGWTRLQSATPADWTEFATLLAEDPTTGTVYGCMYTADGKGYTFGTYDLATCKATVIANLDDDWSAFSFNADGQAYAIDWAGNLLKVNKETGKTSLVAPTGAAPHYAGGGIIDQTTGLFYWTVTRSDGTSALYRVNLETAATEKLTDFANNEQVCGLYLIPGETSGIEEVTAASSAAVVKTGNGIIEIFNAANAHTIIVTSDGSTVASFTGTDYTQIDVEAGLYIVKIGKDVKKVVVR